MTNIQLCRSIFRSQLSPHIMKMYTQYDFSLSELKIFTNLRQNKLFKVSQRLNLFQMWNITTKRNTLGLKTCKYCRMFFYKTLRSKIKSLKKNLALYKCILGVFIKMCVLIIRNLNCYYQNQSWQYIIKIDIWLRRS